MGGRGQNPAMLLRRDDVQEDLKITDEQKAKLTEMQDKMKANRPGRGGGGFGGGQGGPPSDADRAAMMKRFEKMNKDMNDQVKAILTIDQFRRLKEISVQLAGNSAAAQPESQTMLGVTATQKAKIDSLNKQVSEGSGALWQQVRAGTLTMEDVQAKMKTNREALNAEIGKVLTTAQKAKLKEMGGAPFESKDEQTFLVA